jgi:hypothetical protein
MESIRGENTLSLVSCQIAVRRSQKHKSEKIIKSKSKKKIEYK